MSGLIWMGIGGLVALAVSVWALLRRGGDGPDLGTISGQWIAEHRAHERESDKRQPARVVGPKSHESGRSVGDRSGACGEPRDNLSPARAKYVSCEFR